MKMEKKRARVDVPVKVELFQRRRAVAAPVRVGHGLGDRLLGDDLKWRQIKKEKKKKRKEHNSQQSVPSTGRSTHRPRPIGSPQS